MISGRHRLSNMRYIPVRQDLSDNRREDSLFIKEMEKVVLPELSTETLDTCLETLAPSMYESAANSLCPRKEWDTELSRWRRLLESGSPKDVWYTINWKGELNQRENKSQPSPGEFNDHFEKNTECVD